MGSKLIGLTGSIGTGKSAAARIFADLGAYVIDSDKQVHQLLGPKGAAVADVVNAFSKSLVDASGGIDRQALGALVFADGDELQKLEAILHPLVQIQRDQEIAKARQAGYKVIIADVPLLFERKIDCQMDASLVIACDAKILKQRVLLRPDMSAQKLARILAKQMPEAQKRAKADYVIENNGTLAALKVALGTLYERWIDEQKI